LSAVSKGLIRPTALRYVETSALLAAIMEADLKAFASFAAEGQLVASSLTFAEARRATIAGRVLGRFDVDRERRMLEAIEALERRCDVVHISSDILGRVGQPFAAEPLRALDAIHLASSESLVEDPHELVVVTRDKRIEANARAIGYGVE